MCDRPLGLQRASRPDQMTEAELVATATALMGEFRTSDTCVAAEVAAALVSASGHVYTGVCIDTASSLGFCAEHAAIAEMLKARESEIALIVAVSAKFGILAPCGRCRELMWQVDPRNRATRIIVGHGEVVTLTELLPQTGG
jgi:cytidine deaminase